MENKNWSSVLFYKGSELPSFISPRFTLPSGASRYVNDCTLDDIHLAGFSGPVSDPPFNNDTSKKVIWNTDTASWQIVYNSDAAEAVAKEESREVADSLKVIMNQCIDCACGTLTPQYHKKLAEYLGLCYMVIHRHEKGNLVKWSDVPVAPVAYIHENEELVPYQLAWFAENNRQIKEEYETQGLVDTSFLADNSNFWSNVEVPSDWVVGTDPIVPFTMRNSYIIPSGYSLSFGSLSSSGCYYVGVPPSGVLPSGDSPAVFGYGLSD